MEQNNLHAMAKTTERPFAINCYGQNFTADLHWNCPKCGIGCYYDSERFLKNLILWNTCSMCGTRYSVEME